MSTLIQERNIIEYIKKLEQRVSDLERLQRTIQDNEPELSIAQGRAIPANITNSIIPFSSANTGKLGQMAVTNADLYICTTQNTWRKVNINSF
jgi:hypothetical protein